MQKIYYGSVYRHYGGDLYIPEAVARDLTDPKVEMVVLRSPRTNKRYLVPLAFWWGTAKMGDKTVPTFWQDTGTDLPPADMLASLNPVEE